MGPGEYKCLDTADKAPSLTQIIVNVTKWEESSLF